jgi:hypothetical protein
MNTTTTTTSTPPGRGACPEVHLHHHRKRPTRYRLAWIACGRCARCCRDGRRPGEALSTMEFDVAGLSAARRAELFAALRVGKVPMDGRDGPTA